MTPTLSEDTPLFVQTEAEFPTNRYHLARDSAGAGIEINPHESSSAVPVQGKPEYEVQSRDHCGVRQNVYTDSAGTRSVAEVQHGDPNGEMGRGNSPVDLFLCLGTTGTGRRPGIGRAPRGR